MYSLDEGSLQRADAAVDSFRSYIHATVEQLRSTGQGPELARIMLEHRDNEALSEEELTAMYLIILFGGSETTTNLIGNGFLALQRHRAQWGQLVSHPELVRGAVEEMLRYDTPHHYLPRLIVEDFDLHGVPMKKGQTAIIMMGAANHDEAKFADPETFDIHRANKGDHLSLAFGPHYCLGAALARLEGEIVFSTLVRRFPEARLQDDHPRYAGSAMLRAIQHLPVELGPAR
jgi:cytochrome P450